ncbi:MAG TPA: carboxy terminal-processing peptidase, partial [Steroidobacteraceae bacterium]
STQHRGVQPDVPLASVLDTKEIGESALESALPWDRIAGVPFKASAVPAPPVAALATEEGERAQHDPDYKWLVSDIAAIDSVREQHTVSLNLKTRREERARMERERLERENSRRAAKNLAPLKSVEELEKAKDEAADVVLEQAAQVMADMVGGVHPGTPQQKTARADGHFSGVPAKCRVLLRDVCLACRVGRDFVGCFSAAARETDPRCPRRARSASARRPHPARAP